MLGPSVKYLQCIHSIWKFTINEEQNNCLYVIYCLNALDGVHTIRFLNTHSRVLPVQVPKHIAADPIGIDIVAGRYGSHHTDIKIMSGKNMYCKDSNSYIMMPACLVSFK